MYIFFYLKAYRILFINSYGNGVKKIIIFFIIYLKKNIYLFSNERNNIFIIWK